MTDRVCPDWLPIASKPCVKASNLAAPLSALNIAVAAKTLAAKVAYAPTKPEEPLPMVCCIFEKDLVPFATPITPFCCLLKN